MQRRPRKLLGTKSADDLGVEFGVGHESLVDEGPAPALLANLGQQLAKGARAEGVEVFDLTVTAEVDDKIVSDIAEAAGRALAAGVLAGGHGRHA